MKTQKILKFMKDLNKFIEDNEAKIETKNIKVTPDFIKVIEDLMKRDEEFTLNNMDLSKHIIINEDGTFLLSDPLQEAILES